MRLLRPLIAAAGLVALCSVALGQSSAKTKTERIYPTQPARQVAASRIDTRNFSKQVNEVFELQDEEPENPTLPTFLFKNQPKNSLRVGSATLDRVATKGAKFPAINATGWTPADCTLAVGPGNVVVTVNSSLAFFNRAGTKQFQQTLGDFYSGMGAGSFIFDPRCFYDRVSNRYFVVALEQADSPRTSKVLLAVSDDADPNGSWFRYRLESRFQGSGADAWLDYPGFGYNKDAVTVTGNLFGFSGGYYGVYFLNVAKAPMLSGQPITVNYLRDSNAFSVQMGRIWSGTETKLYGISNFNSANAKICAIENPASATPVLSTQFVSIPNFSYPSNLATSKPGFLDPLDGRFLTCDYRDGRLTTSHTVQYGTNQNAARWYEVSTNGWPTTPGASASLRQSGEIAPPDSSQHFFMPAVAQNGNGQISAVFTRSSSSIVADMMIASRQSSDPLGTMGTPQLLQSSEGTGYGGTGENRWGDYFQMDVDPVDDATFWGIAMVGDPNGNWRTHVYSWALSAPTVKTVTLDPASVTGGTNSTGTVTLSVAAPTGGYVVNLTSTNAVATVPTTVTVPAGATAATFTVSTSPTANTATTTIKAAQGTSSAVATLTVVPPVVSSLTLSPSSVTGGSTSTATVTLTGPAPTGGTSVYQSSNSSRATVPGTVTIPAGSTSTTFTVNTLTTLVNTSVTIKTARGPISATAVLTVLAPVIKTVTLSPSSVTGGTKSTATVTLTGPAPSGGLAVYQSSTSSLALVPASVTIPAGSPSVSFDITTKATLNNLSVTIKSARGTNSATATLTLLAPIVTGLSLNPTTVVGGTSSTATVTLSGPAPTGGIAVFQSANSSSVMVPASVTVPAGSSSTTFTVATSATATDKTVTIKSARGPAFGSATLTLRAPLVSSISVNPSTVTGGAATTAKVTLTGPAPVGGVTVYLSSTSSSAPVPASVTVPQGASQVSFTINTLPTTIDKSVTLKAARGSSSATTTLTVKK